MKQLSLGKKIAVGVGAILVFFIIVAAIGSTTLWSQRGKVVKLENKIEARYNFNKSDYDKMWKTFVETAKVTELQAEQFKDVYTELISGRYEDTDLLFKMVQESNPQLGTEVYTNLQRQIAADRSTFNNNQKAILDIINQYNNYIEHDAIIIAFITNRKPIDSSKYIITSERTEKAFESGKDEVIDLQSK
ncbi:virion structural protein [Bacillus phage G]|uniref:Gp142 n=1 Tax=Bacillus phage G TaxID=2884420 RepID=G3MBK8_9CAUD|nr:virion structural protein [Bacillus phage G]AEO93404.1 gp142 [Bacillus phage G]